MAQVAAGNAIPCALVALTVFGATAWACLLCFTSYRERIRICQTFAGVQGPKVEKCEEAFEAAFEGLLDTEISEETRHHPPGPWGVCRGEGPERPGGPRKRETTDWQIGMGDRDSGGRDRD